MTRCCVIAGRGGFTLPEVLVAIVFITLGILGFAFNTMGVIRGNTISGNVTVATSLAQDKLEELKAQPALGNLDNCAFPPESIKATGEAGGIYNRCWTIGDFNASTEPGLKVVTVTVSWRDYLNRQVVLSTLVFTG